jgi:hypothetical protein
MRMSDDEAERLDAVAKKYGLNAAGVLRMLVKREYDALGGPDPKKDSGLATKRLSSKRPKK